MYLSQWELCDALPNDSILDTGMKETLHREGRHQWSGCWPGSLAGGVGKYRGSRVEQTSAQTPRPPHASSVTLGHFPPLSKWQCLPTLL